MSDDTINKINDDIIKALRSQRQRWCDDYWRESAEVARLKHETSERCRRVEEVMKTIYADLDEADALGYSHQSNSYIRNMLETLTDAYNDSQVEEQTET